MSNDKLSDKNQEKLAWAGLFDRMAPTYDQVGPAFFSYFGEKLVDIAGLYQGSNVLDVATGKGAVLFPAAKAVGVEGKVLGIDLSEGMVQETSQKISHRQIPNAETCQMDAERLEFPDETFDFVLCGFAVFFFPHIYQALAEFHRVLKPNGRIAFSTFDRQHFQNWKWLGEVAKRYLPPQPEPEHVPRPEPESKPVFDTPAGLQSLATKAEFADIQVILESSEFVYASADEFWSFLWSFGSRNILEKIERTSGAVGLEEFKSEVFERFNTLKQDDGLHLSVPALFTLAIKA